MASLVSRKGSGSASKRNRIPGMPAVSGRSRSGHLGALAWSSLGLGSVGSLQPRCLLRPAFASSEHRIVWQ
jgi:hypothetical protein